MDEPKAHEVRQWLIKAWHDLGAAHHLITGDTPFRDTAVYHCQQSAEKALKAYLTLNDTPFQKIHDLTVLVEQCIRLDGSFESLRDVCEVLTPYATAFHYPGDVLEPVSSDVDEAITMASEAFEFIRQKMPLEIRTAPGLPVARPET